jgi:hypothetical protein
VDDVTRWIRSHTHLVALVGLAPAPALALQVPVLVQQVLPQGVAGRSWSAEPVAVGVPFAPAEGIGDVRQLGMTGTSAAQFRVLQRDPATNRITWVLATFVADGGPYALTNGSGAFGGADLGRDAGDRYVIETGAARFEVRKSGFDVLDRVVQGGSEVVASHTGGGIVVLAGGTRYESGLDTGSEVVLEENGPVAAVVRARGTLRSAAGGTHFDYLARLHFHRNQAACRVFVTLRNADLGTPAPRTFDAAWVELPLRLAGTRDVLFGFPGNGFSGSLAAGGTAHLFQGDNTFQRSARTGNILPNLTAAVGLEAVIGGATHNALGNSSDVARGWMRLQDATHAVLAGMRDFATLFPSGFDVQSDRIAVEMFSRYNTHTGLVFSWGAHETREIHLAFGAPGADPEPFRARLQYPLLGRCEFARYRDTGALCGEKRLVTADEETQFFAQLGKTWRPSDPTEAEIKLDRQYSFGTTGGPNQFDQDECHLLDFLRTGYGGRFQQGRLGALWKADQAVPHSDDFDYGTFQNGVSGPSVPASTGGFNGKGAGSQFDDEHPHWVVMLHYYHLTGDEHVREAIENYGEWRRYRAGNPTYGALYGGALQHFRLWSRCFRDVALMYECTGQQRYLDDVRRMTQILTGTIERGTSKGRNLERGYFYFGEETDVTRRIHVFFLIEMNPIGAVEALRVLPADDPRREELRDYLYGLGWFTLQEAQISPQAIGYPYGYYAAAPNPELGVRGDQTGLLLAHGYEMSGDPEFIERARSFAWRVLEYQHVLRGSELSTHARIWDWLHRDSMGAALLEPNTARNADGSYTLRWVAPPGAHTYIVKYGAKPLVENLGFDAVARVFRTEPSAAMNFWAATNLSGEPAPGPEGTIEVFRTPVLPAGNWYFKVKVLADRPIAPLRPSDLRLGDLRPPAGPLPGTPSSSRRPAKPADSFPLHIVASQLPGSPAVRFTGLPPGAALQIYSVAGRLVRTLAAPAGGAPVDWDRRDAHGGPVAPGVYLYRVDAAGDRSRRGRVLLVH